VGKQHGSQSVRDAVVQWRVTKDRFYTKAPLSASLSQPVQPVQLLHPLPDIRLCYNSPDTPALSQIQGSPPSSDMLVPWLTSWSWSPSLFGGGDSRLRDGDHGWDAWMAAECSSHPCIHAARQPRNPCTRHLSYHHTPLPPRASSSRCDNTFGTLFVHTHHVTSCNLISVDASLPLRLSTLPVYHQPPPFHYHIIYRILAQIPFYFWLPHRAAPIVSPRTPLQPIPHPYTHTHPLPTPSSCSSPSSPPC
jgi:hypothetical protein